MNRLWSPWRMAYLTAPKGEQEDIGCIFCDRLAQDSDEENHILYRGGASFVILNAYPYNTGHLMVAPRRHVGDLADLGSDERTELMEITFQAVEALKEKMAAEGLNVGMNLGSVAGAGIPGHIHMHVVPRWAGDTNFMPVIGDTKVLPEMLADTDRKLRPFFSPL